MSTLIRLPDLFADSPPAELTLNPGHRTICAASTAWVETYKPFDEKTQNKFNRSNFGFLTAAGYPHAGPVHFRAACDLINYYFVFDDTSDGRTGAAVRELAAVVIDALSNPSKTRPPGESFLGEMAKSFWSKALEISSASSARRFVKNFAGYAEALAEEAEDRDHERVRSIEDYLNVRRHGIAVRTSFDFLLLPDDLPDEVIAHPAIERLVSGGIDMSILANDVYSYNKEQAAEENPHNMVTVVMNEKGLDVQGAMDYVGKQYREVAKTFMDDRAKVPSFGHLDGLVAKFIQGIAIWNIANIEWSYSSERYFGTKGQEVKSSLVMELMPKKFNQ